MLLLTALLSGSGKSGLDPLVLLSTHSDCRLGIGLTPQSRSNTSIESTWPVGRNPNHSAECADRKTRYLCHSNFSQCSTSC